MQLETWVQSLDWEDILKQEMAALLIILTGEFHGQRSLAGYSPWDHEELDTTEQTHMYVINIRCQRVKLHLIP